MLRVCDTGLLGYATIRARNTLEQRRVVTRRRWNLRRLLLGKPCGHESYIERGVCWMLEGLGGLERPERCDDSSSKVSVLVSEQIRCHLVVFVSISDDIAVSSVVTSNG